VFGVSILVMELIVCLSIRMVHFGVGHVVVGFCS